MMRRTTKAPPFLKLTALNRYQESSRLESHI